MARVTAFQAVGCGFESRLPLWSANTSEGLYFFCPIELLAHVAQAVEHILGKDEVTGSNPVVGFKKVEV